MTNEQKVLVELRSAVGDLTCVVSSLLRRQSFIDPSLDELMIAVTRSLEESWNTIRKMLDDQQFQQKEG